MIHPRINEPERLLTLHYGGKVCVADWRKTMAQVIADCPDVVTFDSINDLRSTDNFLTAAEIDDFTVAVRRSGMQSHPRRAVTLSKHKAHFGLARMFELLTQSDGNVARLTTESIAEAARWLKRPEALIQAELAAAVPPASARGDRRLAPKGARSVFNG